MTIKQETVILDERVQHVQDDRLRVDLQDGRTILVPLAWYPRLEQAIPIQRDAWIILEDGYTIRWTELDETLGTEELLWDGPSGHEERKEMDKALREMAAEEARQTEAALLMETLVKDTACYDENDSYETKVLAWAETAIRRYQQ